MADSETKDNNSETHHSSHESFVRWQQVTNNERGKAINLFLGMSFATVGFVINQVMKTDFNFSYCCDKILIGVGTFLLLLHIIILVLLVLNRLKDDRLTANLAKIRNINPKGEVESLRKEVKEIGACTHLLFKISLLIFAIAEPLIIIGFIINVFHKF